MVQVASSKGGLISIEIKGVSETIRRIRQSAQDVHDGMDLGVFQASTVYLGEVQESAIGNRAEPKSVRTGTFANTIDILKLGESSYQVFSAVKYSIYLEYGTTKISPRRHFRNSLDRNREYMNQIIADAIRRKLESGQK